MDAQTQNPPAERLVLTVPEAAQLLGISRESAYKAARVGQIPVVVLGRRMLVPVARLRQMLGVDDARAG